MTTTRIPQPTGRTSAAWFGHGYQQALRDILAMRDAKGLAGVDEWLANNIKTATGEPTCPGCGSVNLEWCGDNYACLGCGDEWSPAQIKGALA